MPVAEAVEEDLGTDVNAGDISSEITPKTPVISDNWKDLIPEDIRKESVIAQTKDITSMAKQLVSAQKMIGSRLKLPADGDTAGWDEVYNKLGRPESIDGYKVARPESDNGVPYSEEREKEFLSAAHKIGLNNSQVQALINWNQEQIKHKKVAYNFYS